MFHVDAADVFRTTVSDVQVTVVDDVGVEAIVADDSLCAERTQPVQSNAGKQQPQHASRCWRGPLKGVGSDSFECVILERYRDTVSRVSYARLRDVRTSQTNVLHHHSMLPNEFVRLPL